MYSGVGSRINSPNTESSEIPEWKRLLIMKKRAAMPTSIGEEGCNSELQTRSHFGGPVSCTESGGGRATSSSGSCDSPSVSHASKFSMLRTAGDSVESEKVATLVAETPPETVIRTIGNIKIELRSVYKSPAENGAEDERAIERLLTSPLSEPAYHDSEEEEDLQYGPGIVDRLRSKFLNLGQKSKRKPVVRKFSSLENLSGGTWGMYRTGGISHPRGEKNRLGGTKITANASHRIFPNCNFKKAQSMETLLVAGVVDSSPFSNRRVNARIFQRQPRNSSIPNDKGSSPTPRYADGATPRVDGKLVNRFEYNRQVSGSNIKEDELPKPDTVKHFKRIFESPATDKSCHVPVNQAIYEKGPHIRATSIASSTSNAMKNINSPTSGKIHTLAGAYGNSLNESDELSANDESAKEESSTNKLGVKTLAVCDESYNEEDVEPKELSPVDEVNVVLSLNHNSSPEINGLESTFISSPASSPTVSEVSTLLEADVNKESAKLAEILSPDTSEIEDYPVVKVNPEQLPLLIESPSSSNSDLESPQGSQVSDEPERSEEENLSCVIARPHLEEGGDSSSLADMVIARSSEGDHPDTAQLLKQTLKKPNWQKPPPPTTSIVFDFRGKDVKPQISLQPAPFGCRPAKVKKRAGSPPRGDTFTVNGDHPNSSEEEDDEEDWDEMDIGADLPAISGITFTGENVIVGKGSLLVRRNKKLSIQFNDEAISTYEYPCESPPPFEENGHDLSILGSNMRPLKSSFAINNAPVNTALSNYTPHALDCSEEFQLGVLPPPPPIHRRQPIPSEKKYEAPDEIIPADPEDSSGWSATETADILF